MKYQSLAVSLLFMATTGVSLAQTTPTTVVEDFKISATTQQGKQYPQVNSEGRVRDQIAASEARRVLLDVGAGKYGWRFCT